jgi:hypothetical protein
MPLRDPGVFLEDIEHYAAAAVRFTSGLSLEQYLADEKTRAAVERVLEVCGEAMSHLYKVAPCRRRVDPPRARHHRLSEYSRAWLCRTGSQQGIQHAPELLLAAQEALKNFPAPP